MNGESEEFGFSNLFVPLTKVKAICFIFLIGFLLFFNSLFNDFVGDDRAQIVDNPKIHSLSNISSFFLENRLSHSEDKSALGATYYKPMLDVAFSTIYALFGSSTFAFHFFQILLFIINACLLFLLFKSFFRLETSFILALIYLVHPINSEDAIYISALQEVLFTFFGIGALLLIVNFKKGKKIFAALFGLFLALISKETGVLYFAICFLYEFIFARKFAFYFAVAGGIVFGGYLLLRNNAVGLFSHSLINAPIQALDFWQRVSNMPLIFLYYLKAFIFPLNLSSSYQWVIKRPELLNFYLPLILDLVLIALLTWFGYYLYKRKKQNYFKLYLFFSLWFLIGLAFHSQFLPLDQTVAERWFYFPVIGLLGVIGVLLEFYEVNFKKNFVLVGVVLIITLFSIRTFLRTFDYRDDFTLATRDVLVSPESYNLEYIISHSYYEQGKLEEAKFHAIKSVELFPYITNHTNLGAIYSRMGDYKNARENYLKALEFGDDKLPYANLTALSLVYGDRHENIEFIKNIALKKYPNEGKMWLQLGMLEYMAGDVENAKIDLDQAQKLGRDPMIDFIRNLIANKKKLEIKAENGEMKFIIGD